MSYAENGKLTGFEPKLLVAMAKAGNFTVTYKVMSFGALLTALQAKQIDAAMSNIDITPERQKAVDFTDSEFLDHIVLGVPSSSGIQSFDDLKGKTIVGTTGVRHVHRGTEARRQVWSEGHRPGYDQLPTTRPSNPVRPRPS